MSQQDEIVPPEEVVSWINPHSAKLMHCYGAIVILADDGRIASKGSMVLVEAATGRFIFTANHVANEVRMRTSRLIIRPEIQEEDALRPQFSGAVQFPLTADDVAWSSKEMDVAAFRAPAAMVKLPYLRFDAGASVIATAAVRRKWKPDVPLPTLVMGCPDYGHLRARNHDTLGFLVMQGYITAFDREPWDGISRVAQIHLEIEDGSKREQPPQTGLRQQQWQSLQEKKSGGRVPLGGYSGAPFIVIGTDGEFLIGIITEGDYVFGQARATAVAWDDVMTAFEAAP